MPHNIELILTLTGGLHNMQKSPSGGIVMDALKFAGRHAAGSLLSQKIQVISKLTGQISLAARSSDV